MPFFRQFKNRFGMSKQINNIFDASSEHVHIRGQIIGSWIRRQMMDSQIRGI